MGMLDGIGSALSGIWGATGAALRNLTGQAPPPQPPAGREAPRDTARLAYAKGWEATAAQTARRSVLGVADPMDPLLAANDARRQLATFSAFAQNQGKTNACGTTSLSMIMSFWKNQPGAYSKELLDPEIRQFDLPSSPHNLMEYARGQGFRASARNGSNLAEIKRLIDLGIPPQVLINPPKAEMQANGRLGLGASQWTDDWDTVLHYTVVTNYTTDKDGNLVSVVLQDPQLGNLVVPAADFDRWWSNLKVVGQDTGISRMILAVAPGDDTPVAGRDGVVRAARDLQLPATDGISPAAMWFDVLTKGTNATGRTADGIAGAVRSAWDGLTGGIASAWKSLFG